ncbi:MAG TPA: malate synthase A [Planctomycetota bacterium]|nr:malate synthase A [Planctomycetota bacterium]
MREPSSVVQPQFTQQVPGLQVLAPVAPEHAALLSDAALTFVALLERRFRERRRRLLARRALVQARLDAGARPGFSTKTRAIRAASWRVAPVPHDLQDRRVEITGPVDRKMVINALNSGARTYMADFEDSSSPTWRNLLDGQRNLRDAVRKTIDYTDPAAGKDYRLHDTTAVLLVRPRGWHLDEQHVLLDGEPVSAALFDFALFLFWNAHELRARGSGPYFYLPKLESHLEARLWNDVFVLAQDALELPRGTIKATVLIETILAAFEMDEILYELREHSAGLNCGRWDYIFSFIKKFRSQPRYMLPDRATITMRQHFLHSYSLLLIQTCHRRGAHAIGGMAAQIPIKHDAERNRQALEKVREDKQREAGAGHDGTWVAHPALVAIAQREFDAVMPGPNQIHRQRDDVQVTAADLPQVPNGAITEHGLRHDLNVGIRYLESWLRGQGCVPIDDLMEDAATVEISRAQVWQWLHHGAHFDTGALIDQALVERLIEEELASIRSGVGAERWALRRFGLATQIFRRLVLEPECAEFLTVLAYEHILTLQNS